MMPTRASVLLTSPTKTRGEAGFGVGAVLAAQPSALNSARASDEAAIPNSNLMTVSCFTSIRSLLDLP
jgi:hypothetical protein